MTSSLPTTKELEEILEPFHVRAGGISCANAKLKAVRQLQTIMAKERTQLRELVANYIFSEGCHCCEGPGHDEDKKALAEALSVEKYEDESGYNFHKYESNKGAR